MSVNDALYMILYAMAGLPSAVAIILALLWRRNNRRKD